MAKDADDSIGCLFGLGALAFGGWWLYQNYEVKSREPTVPVPQIAEPSRPTGLVQLTALKDGSVWLLDNDSVKGGRTDRVAWVKEDHAKNKTIKASYSMTLYRINCDTTGYRVLSIVEYGKDGNTVKSWAESLFGKEWSYAVPTSNMSTVTNEVCSPLFDRAAQPEKNIP